MSRVPPLAETSVVGSGEATAVRISSTELRSAQIFFAKWFVLQTIRIGTWPRSQTNVYALMMAAELSNRSHLYAGGRSGHVKGLSGYVRGGLLSGITMVSASLFSLFT